MHPNWTMPEWMEPYRHLIVNTGGNTIEGLMRDDNPHNNCKNNPIRMALYCAVSSQLTLLESLDRVGLLKRPE